MTLKQYLFSMFLGTAVTWTTVGLIVAFVDPTQAGPVAAGTLLFALLLGLTGILAVLGVIVRVFVLRRRGLVSEHVRVSLRQGAFIALLASLSLLLAHLKLFAWWNIALAIAALAIAEYFFITGEAKPDDEAGEYEAS